MGRTKSRYVHYDKRSLPAQKRTISVWGADTETTKQSNKLFKCWNCGFTCNVDRDERGDGVGYVVVDQIDVSYPVQQGVDKRDCSVVMPDAYQTAPVLMKLDCTGVPMPVVYNFTQDVMSGCPSCGSRNYK